MARLWILGASDPEMAAIERLLAALGEEYAIASVDGQRVHPGNAYRATHPDPSVWRGREVVMVECGYDPALCWILGYGRGAGRTLVRRGIRPQRA